MTPQNQMGNMGNAPITGQGADNLYSSISSAGQSPEIEQQSPAPTDQLSPAEQFIQRFGSVVSPLNSLLESYPQASQQAEDVKKALSNWISAVNGQLSQEAGGESSPL